MQIRGLLGKKKGQIDLQISNLLRALGDGRAYDTILSRLDSLDKEKNDVIAEMQRLDMEIQRDTVKRPTARMIQRVWSEMIELWEYATEEERAELMSLIVKDVVITEKNSVSLHLNPIADFSEFGVRNNDRSWSGDPLCRYLQPSCGLADQAFRDPEKRKTRPAGSIGPAFSYRTWPLPRRRFVEEC